MAKYNEGDELITKKGHRFRINARHSPYSYNVTFLETDRTLDVGRIHTVLKDVYSPYQHKSLYKYRIGDSFTTDDGFDFTILNISRVNDGKRQRTKYLVEFHETGRIVSAAEIRKVITGGYSPLYTRGMNPSIRVNR